LDIIRISVETYGYISLVLVSPVKTKKAALTSDSLFIE